MLLPFILGTIIYWMSAILNDADAYIRVVLILVLNTQIACSYATFISVLAPNVDAALGMVIPILMPILIFAGFFLNTDSTPVYFIWIKYISWMYYTNESMNAVIWSKTGSIPCTKNATMFNPNGTACGSKGCFNDGNEVLDFLGFTTVSMTSEFQF